MISLPLSPPSPVAAHLFLRCWVVLHLILIPGCHLSLSVRAGTDSEPRIIRIISPSHLSIDWLSMGHTRWYIIVIEEVILRRLHVPTIVLVMFYL